MGTPSRNCEFAPLSRNCRFQRVSFRKAIRQSPPPVETGARLSQSYSDFTNYRVVSVITMLRLQPQDRPPLRISDDLSSNGLRCSYGKSCARGIEDTED